jgi:hypothetical protein
MVRILKQAVFFLLCIGLNFGISFAQVENLSENHNLEVLVTPIAEFKITTPGGVNLAFNAFNTELNDSDTRYSVFHNSINEKIVTVEISGFSGDAKGVRLKAALAAPAAGDAASTGELTIHDGADTVSPAAQVAVEKIPAGLFDNLQLNYKASADFSATVGSHIFTLTFTITEL